MTATTAEKIIESFPHPTIIPIIGQPNYESIAEVHLKLNTNAASVHSHRGNGNLGLLFLTVTPEVCDTLSDVPFDPPPNPGQHPCMPEGSTGPQIADLRRQHREACEEYLQYDQTDKALKSLLIAAVDEVYVRSLRHKYVGYANVKTLTMIAHLCDNYARVTASSLKENDVRLNQPWDPNQAIETLIDQVEDAVDYAAAGKAPHAATQIVNAAHNLVFETGMHNDYCKDWRKKDDADKTWAEFKMFFTKANQDLRDSGVTARSAGYQANNVSQAQTDVQDTPQEVQALEAIANLATASTENRESIATLTATNAALVKELVELRLEAKNLRATLSRRNKFSNYCWSCGMNCDHTSRACQNKKEGHKVQATLRNMLGGSIEVFQRS